MEEPWAIAPRLFLRLDGEGLEQNPSNPAIETCRWSPRLA